MDITNSRKGLLMLAILTSQLWASLSFPTGPPKVHYEGCEEGPKYQATKNKLRDVDWKADAQSFLRAKLAETFKAKPAKNIILFIGDGMGVSTVTAARILKAQKEGTSLHESHLAWEKFPFTSVAKTYCIDQMTADSASTATAILTGYKTNGYMLGVNQKVKRANCASMTDDTKLESILKLAHKAGKWTGIVTTTRVTHATPAGAYANSPDRKWEYDTLAVESPCKDIARQLVEDNDFIKVVMGGGRRNFLGRNETDPEYADKSGYRYDGSNLMNIWRTKQSAKAGVDESKVKVVYDKKSFDEIDPAKTEYVLGLFERSHMQYEIERTNEPSLAEMTEKAIKLLQKNDAGFILEVEGGRVDHGHHDNKAYKALTETIALSDAVQKAVELTNAEDTLILTTADHSHAFTFAGYTHPDQNILDISRRNVLGTHDEVAVQLADDDLPWLPLAYANGPGYAYHRGNGTPRRNLTVDDLTKATRDKDYAMDAAVPLEIATHGGEDVIVYAHGPMAHLFHGTHEQSYIAHALMYASCVAGDKSLCQTSAANMNSTHLSLFVTIIISIWQTGKTISP